jgi:hypothetical protein
MYSQTCRIQHPKQEICFVSQCTVSRNKQCCSRIFTNNIQFHQFKYIYVEKKYLPCLYLLSVENNLKNYWNKFCKFLHWINLVSCAVLGVQTLSASEIQHHQNFLIWGIDKVSNIAQLNCLSLLFRHCDFQYILIVILILSPICGYNLALWGHDLICIYTSLGNRNTNMIDRSGQKLWYPVICRDQNWKCRLEKET